MLNDLIARYTRAMTANIDDENQVKHIKALFFEGMFFACQTVAMVWDTSNKRLKAHYKARELVAFDRASDIYIKSFFKEES